VTALKIDGAADWMDGLKPVPGVYTFFTSFSRFSNLVVLTTGPVLSFIC
jgi:hypothetical protein